MLAKRVASLIVVVILPLSVQALMVSANLGLGNSKTTNEATETEAPFAQLYTVERTFHSRLSVGVEHLRSLKSTLASSISFTGVVARYYLNGAPMAILPPELMTSDQVIMRDYNIFIGSGGGNAQSSRLPNSEKLSSNAAGVYISPRAGLDYQLGQHLGARTEVIMAFTIFGTGKISTMTLSGGIYWLF